VQALRLCTGRTAHRGSGGIALLFLDQGSRRGEGSESHPGRSLPPGKTRYPLHRRLSGLQDRSGHVRKIFPPPGFDPRTIQPVAQSLYRLSYRAHDIIRLPCSKQLHENMFIIKNTRTNNMLLVMYSTVSDNLHVFVQ